MRLGRYALVVLLAAGVPARARTALDLQPFLKSAEALDPRGDQIRLVDLNPTVGRWYLLELNQNPPLNLETPDGVTLTLDARSGLLVATNGYQTRSCAVDGPDGPIAAAASELPYAPACGGAVWVRKAAKGRRSWLEAATDMLRLTGGAGEALINFYKNNFNTTAEAASYAGGTREAEHPAGGPAPAALPAPWNGRVTGRGQLGIALDGVESGEMVLGTWYPARKARGVFAALLTPEAAGAADDPGSADMAYFVAWDTSLYALRYALGTEHPSLEWSDRAPGPHPGRGPDGFDDPAPLARVGMVPPYDRALLAGSFSGGFKRKHSAIRSGPLGGVHYGFAEDGVVLSRLQPGLMTIFAGLDGIAHMRSFSTEDAGRGAAGLLVARQTGFPLVESGEEGAHVGDYSGNWSGSNDKQLLTMRASACVIPGNGTSWLVYGVFTSATPKQMATTLKALGCKDAGLLDMNSPVLVYGAIYGHDQGRLLPEHLMRSMGSGDDGGRLKFVDEPDSRDFFYLVKRSPD